MKTRNLFISICATLLILTLFGGCKGEKGDAGDLGPEGPAGLPNSIYSDFFSLTWSGSPTDKSGIKTMVSRAEAGYENSIILVYGIKSPNTHVTFQLPCNRSSGSSNAFDFEWQAGQSTGTYILTIRATNSGGFTGVNDLANFKFRWILVSVGGKQVGGRKAAIDYSDYEAVKKAYNIPD